jgi:hypothetical protein
MAIPFAALGRPKRGIVRIPPGGHPAPVEVAPAPAEPQAGVAEPVVVEAPVVEAAEVAEPSAPVVAEEPVVVAEEPVSEPEPSTPDLSEMPKVNSGSSKTDMLAAATYLNLPVSSANTRAEIWSAIQAVIGV